MDKLAVGILAHVDAGKTTLSEALLYRSGVLRTLGRVDHADAFLDTDALERERGITIFSKQAVLPLPDVELTLLDTPGHADFSAEMERTLQVLDCAILVISGTDGVQAHTRTLWGLLEEYGIPTVLFLNKMDLAGADRAALLEQLRSRLGDGFVDFSSGEESRQEAVAMCGETALEEYLETGAVSDRETSALIASRALFPCFFGSALKLDGVDEFLAGLDRFLPRPVRPGDFGARVFKIARDTQGARLTYLKVTGGSLRVKALLSGGAGENGWEEKVDQIRIYSGEKFRTADEVGPGTVCAVTGLTRTRPGEGLGAEEGVTVPLLESPLTYQVLLPDGCDVHAALLKLRELEEEDPLLHIVWNEQLREIHLRLMGEIQLEILRRVAAERFGLDLSFGPGSIVYRETIAAPVEGIGHYEPLRHYAEVHLLLEPGERGSGVQIGTACSTDALEGHWQRLILTHLEETDHPGVLTGSPITDIRLILVAGKAHEKHTEGGDFRQATYRAVRQGLMSAESVLLEPWYRFRLELPVSASGRAMTDLQLMGAELAPMETLGESVLLTGRGSVRALRDYSAEVTAYTRGQGHLSCTFCGYEPCPAQSEVVAEIGYDPLRDLERSPDSVFCSHGAGTVVPWNEVPAHAHIDSGLRLGKAAPSGTGESSARRSGAQGLALDKELQAIFERTYGPVKPRAFRPSPAAGRHALSDEHVEISARAVGTEYLLVDGYNIIFAWEELKVIARESLDGARQALLELLSNYQGFRKCEVILVFDAYKVPGSLGKVEKYNNIYVVYTKEAETADSYIERATYDLGREHRVRVATSDSAEQMIILGHGALRLSARTFHAEVAQVTGEIAAAIARNNAHQKSYNVRLAMEKAQQKKET